MTTPAEQYRALVKKLEAITEADLKYKLDANGQMVPQDSATAAADAAGTGLPTAPAQADPSIPDESGQGTATDAQKIDAVMNQPTFNAAYAMAKKLGMKKFKWCKEYVVKDAPRPPPVQQTARPATPDRINSQYADGSYVGGIGLPSQTPVFNTGAEE